ncbi:DegV family protein [Psychrobacillus sp.]|uniref:DegV family protein n=1 Tax=Psychrobacillus sp. TaxID=1871623 RepID=UPI0028BD3304|nr:DegV family protein [Psychrobacillus sp.]
MTKKIAWITDTAPLLDKAFIKKHEVHILPLNIVFEEGAFKETIDMTHDEFYDKLRVAKHHPKTSQPAIGEMVALYEKLKKEGYDCAVAIHVSSELSGTFHSSQSASLMADFQVYSIDSKIGSYPMVKMIEIGQDMVDKGHDVKEVVAYIETMAKNSELSFIPSSLNQLHKSGRVSGTQTFLSNLLNIKVVISFDHGKVVMKEKVRADKRARKYVTNLLRSDMDKASVPEVAVINCNNTKDAENWKEELLLEFPNLSVLVLPLSACVGVHAGEGTTGLSWVKY